jgi:hypothetical protein
LPCWPNQPRQLQQHKWHQKPHQPIGLVSLIGLSLVSLVSLIGHIGFGFISLIGLGNLSITSLIDIIGQTGFIGPSASLVFQLVSLIGSTTYHCSHNCLAVVKAIITTSIIPCPLKQSATHGVAMAHLSATEILKANTFYFPFVMEMMCWWLARARKRMWWWIASFGYSDHNDVIKYHLATAILAAAAQTIPPRRMQDTTMSSAIKISNAPFFFCAYYAHLFVRESWLWHVFLPRLNSSFYHDSLQNAKQLFYISLPFMTKYCIMRECEKILHGYLFNGDLVFVILKGTSIFKFPKRFLEISSRDLTSSLLLFFFI